MAYEFKLPDLGEGLTEGEVARWLVAGGPGDRRGRPARRGADRQGDGRDPVAGGREGRADPRRGGRGRRGRDGARRDRRRRRRFAPRPDRAQDARRRSREARRRRAPKGGPVRATPLVRRIAAELGVDLAVVTGTRAAGPDHRGRRARALPAVQVRSAAPEGDAIRCAACSRVIAEHLTRAHREVPAVTWVEECDFSGVDLEAARAARPPRGARVAAGVPGAERPPRGRRDRLARPLRPRRRRPDRAGARRPGRPRLRHALGRRARRRGATARPRRRGRDAQAGGAARLDVHGHERRQARRPVRDADRSTIPRSAILGVDRIAERPGRPRRRGRRRPIGNVSVTFDHRVVDGARAAEFGLAVIGRLEQGA